MQILREKKMRNEPRRVCKEYACETVAFPHHHHHRRPVRRISRMKVIRVTLLRNIKMNYQLNTEAISDQ